MSNNINTMLFITFFYNYVFNGKHFCKPIYKTVTRASLFYKIILILKYSYKKNYKKICLYYYF